MPKPKPSLYNADELAAGNEVLAALCDAGMRAKPEKFDHYDMTSSQQFVVCDGKPRAVLAALRKIGYRRFWRDKPGGEHGLHKRRPVTDDSGWSENYHSVTYLERYGNLYLRSAGRDDMF